MLNKIIPKSQFARNIIILMTGTGIAQAIPISLSPILTRLFSPEDFGLFALYTGLSTILLVFATGKYELAIMLPVKDNDALDIVKLVSIITTLISFLIFIIVFFFNKEICIILSNEEIGKWLYFLPLTVFITGIYQSLNYWFNRKRDFRRLAKNRVVQSSSTGGSQLLFGFQGLSGIGLLFGSLIGQSLTVIGLFIKIVREESKNLFSFDLKNMKKNFVKFIDFPKYELPSNLLNVGSTHAPNVLFAALFSSNYSGYYYLTQRVLQAPLTLISTSVLDVFKEEASRQYRETGEAKIIYKKTFKWLFYISLFPSIVLFFFVEDLFVFFFGSKWVMAGIYAKILLPSLTIKFLANPLSFMIYIAEKQKWNLLIMIFLIVGIFLSFYISSNHLNVIKGISMTLIIYYSIHLIVSAKIAKVL